MASTGWNGSKVYRLKRLVIQEYGDICHLCGGPGADSVDHVIPRSMGGDDSLDNLRPAHARCNSARGARSLYEWHKRRAGTGAAASRAAPSREWKA